MNFQENLRNYREKKGYSSKEFANILKIPYPTYKGYENQKREPKYELLIQIADLLNVSLDDLLGRKSENENKKIKEFLSDLLSEQYEKDISLILVDVSSENINFKANIKNEEFKFSMPTDFFSKGFHNVNKLYSSMMQGDIKNYLYYYAIKKFIQTTAKDRFNSINSRGYVNFINYIEDLFELQSDFIKGGEALTEFGEDK